MEFCRSQVLAEVEGIPTIGAMGRAQPESKIWLPVIILLLFCLLYTSDAADERSSVDLGGRRSIKKKKILEKYLFGTECKNINQKYE